MQELLQCDEDDDEMEGDEGVNLLDLDMMPVSEDEGCAEGDAEMGEGDETMKGAALDVAGGDTEDFASKELVTGVCLDPTTLDTLPFDMNMGLATLLEPSQGGEPDREAESEVMEAAAAGSATPSITTTAPDSSCSSSKTVAATASSTPSTLSRRAESLPDDESTLDAKIRELEQLDGITPKTVLHALSCACLERVTRTMEGLRTRMSMG